MSFTLNITPGPRPPFDEMRSEIVGFLLSDAPMWRLSGWDDKLVIYTTHTHTHESFDQLQKLLVLIFLQSRIEEMGKTSKTVKVEREFNRRIWKRQNKRTCLWGGRGDNATHWVEPPHCAHACWPRWLNTSHPSSRRWSCSWSELSNNWPCCLLGKLLHFVFWLIGSVYTSVPASRLPTLVWSVSKWTIWSHGEETHEIRSTRLCFCQVCLRSKWITFSSSSRSQSGDLEHTTCNTESWSCAVQARWN